ncbi:MAG TPA: hypothetical protein VF711_05615 [Acidimicrobiales bacterium]
MSVQDFDETTLESLFSGKAAASVDTELAAFVDDLRLSVSGPPPPPAAPLAALLTEGFPIDHHEPSRPRRRKMMISELLAGLAAKLAALGVAGKVALGLGLATASAASAGAAGALPDAAQHALATVVNTTPLHIPDVASAADDGQTMVPAVSGDIVPGGSSATDDDATDDATDPAADNHGACVSAVAKSAPKGAGGVHGKAVSAAAHSCPGKEGSDDESTSTTSTSTTVEPVPTTVSPTGGDAAEGGQGHGKSGENHGSSGQSHGKGSQGH